MPLEFANLDAVIAKRTRAQERFLAALAHLATNRSKMEGMLAEMVREFGEDEVQKVSAINMKRMKEDALPPRELAEARWLEYVDFHRRFGGKRPFVPQPEFKRLSAERLKYSGRLQAGQALTKAEHERFVTLCDLLMSSYYLCEDLLTSTGQAVEAAEPPPRPDSDSK